MLFNEEVTAIGSLEVPVLMAQVRLLTLIPEIMVVALAYVAHRTIIWTWRVNKKNTSNASTWNVNDTATCTYLSRG